MLYWNNDRKVDYKNISNENGIIIKCTDWIETKTSYDLYNNGEFIAKLDKSYNKISNC